MAVEGIVVTGECSSCTLALGRLEFGAKAVRNPRAQQWWTPARNAHT